MASVPEIGVKVNQSGSLDATEDVLKEAIGKKNKTKQKKAHISNTSGVNRSKHNAGNTLINTIPAEKHVVTYYRQILYDNLLQSDTKINDWDYFLLFY